MPGSAWTNQVVSSVIIQSAGSGQGLFVYSPTVGAGNLIASIAAANGTDSYGNAYLAGITSYHTTGANSWYAVVNAQAFTSYYFATSSAGPWTFQAAVRGDITTGVLTFQANSNVETTVPLALDNVAAPATPTGSAWMYGGTGHVKYVGTDGGAYNTGQTTLYKTSAQTINSQSFTPVTFANGGPTLPVSAAAYRIKIYGSYLENAAAGTPSFEITGPATSNVELLTEIYSVAGAAAVLTNRTTALGGSGFTGPAMASLTRIFNIEGLIVFSAAGSVGFSALTSVAADTFNIQAGTFMELVPIS